MRSFVQGRVLWCSLHTEINNGVELALTGEAGDPSGPGAAAGGGDVVS